MTEKTGIEKTLEYFRESLKGNEKYFLIDQKLKEFDLRLDNATTSEDLERIRKDFDEFRKSQH